MSPSAERLRRLVPLGSLLLVTIYGLALLWPVPLGRMPLSADHTVHLTRIWMTAGELASGNLRGWSPVWFFGTPVGELYPVLGDLVIIVARALSLGMLSWPAAYALGFSLVFVAQGWVMLRIGRAMGIGAVPGLVAALLVMSDAGAYREGGWEYTVLYGVWPQTLATSLTWLALAEIAWAVQADAVGLRGRRIAAAAAAMGAALLAHPMSMLSLAIGGPLLVLMLGGWSRQRLERAVTVGVLAAVLGVVTAVWWLVPMFDHRGWMASYGWLWLPLEHMIRAAKQGQLAQHMPAAVGATCGLGMVAIALIGSRFARFVGVYAIVVWLLASQDVVWALRLDRLSDGFTHIQYQRFVTLAKPGFFLVAGAAVGLAVRGAVACWRGRHPAMKALAGLALAAAVVLAAWMATQQARVMKAREVGTVQLVRAPSLPALDEDYAALLEWMRARWDERTRFYRATVHENRNAHWFMDAPVFTSMPLYKQGFTPGDNFVHKPEAGAPVLLDRLQVRYVISLRRGSWRDADPIATFGAITVFERRGWDRHRVAWLDGPGTLEIIEDDPARVRVRVRGSDSTTRLVFGIAGHPRWTLEGEAGAVEWFEAPALGVGRGSTPQARRLGELRGGKAHGNDGTEPTLIAAQVGEGEYVLRYRSRRVRDVLAGLLSLVGLGICASLVWCAREGRASRRARQWLVAIERTLGRVAHPIVVALCILAVGGFVGLRQARGKRHEADQAVAWLLDGRAAATRIEPGLFKTDMLIRPALRVAPRRKGQAVLELPGVPLGDVLRGWVAIDDDAAKVRGRGTHRLRIEARPPGGDWVVLHEQAVPHQPGRRLLEISTESLRGATADIRVVVTPSGDAPPPLGFDLELGGGA